MEGAPRTEGSGLAGTEETPAVVYFEGAALDLSEGLILESSLAVRPDTPEPTLVRLYNPRGTLMPPVGTKEACEKSREGASA